MRASLGNVVKILIVCVACVAFNTAEVHADDGFQKLLTAERSVVATGAAWSMITSLDDGSLGMVYEQARAVGDIEAVNVSMAWVRSTDGGQSWSEPITISERLGAGGQLYDTRLDGGYIVYEQRNHSIGQLASGRLVCVTGELDYHYDSQGKEEVMTKYGSTFEYKRMVTTYSDDMGLTWSSGVELPNLPVGGDWSFDHPAAGGTTFRIVDLNDGTALMSIYGNYDPSYSHSDISAGTGVVAGVLRSTDNGLTWGDFTPIMTKTSELAYEETALCVLSDGKLLAHIRQPEGNLKQYTSVDQGRTWSVPTNLTPLWGQHPGGAFELESGLVMATWGNRVGPDGPAEDAYFGATGMISYNGGASWDYEHRVALDWGLTDGNCGYATGAQAGDGSIVVTYYDMLPASNNTGRWLGSEVYTVRFTEEQFLAASGGSPPEPPSGLNMDVTFTSGAMPSDFGMQGGGSVDPMGNVSDGTWTNSLAAGQTSFWSGGASAGEVTGNIIGPVIHGFAEIGHATLGGGNDDQTVIGLGTSIWGDFSFLVYFTNGVMAVRGGTNASSFSTEVSNQDLAGHVYGWEFDMTTNMLKLFFDDEPVGLAEGYYVGGNFFAEEGIYFGDGSGGYTHGEIWDRWVVAEGAYSTPEPSTLVMLTCSLVMFFKTRLRRGTCECKPAR